MAEFIPTEGFENCSKCGGWQVLDKTIRKPTGWPVGPIVMVDCDNCSGRGEIKLAVAPKPIVIRDNSGLVIKRIEPEPPEAPAEPPSSPRGWGAPPEPSEPVEPVKQGWASYGD